MRPVAQSIKTALCALSAPAGKENTRMTASNAAVIPANNRFKCITPE